MINNTTTQSAVLILQDGTTFKGKALGKIGTSLGKICFNTAMTAYQELVTDTSSSGKILVLTNNHVGNYGVLDADAESPAVQIAGLVCKKFSGKLFSRAKSENSLQTYFENNDITGISDIDTRALVLHLREKGMQNCIISSETDDVKKLTAQLASFVQKNGADISREISCSSPYFVGNENATYKVAVLDFGVKKSVIHWLIEQDAYVKVFPYNSSTKDILDWQPNGILISNGAGNPDKLSKEISNIKQLQESGVALLGVGFGAILLAAANEISISKMLHGHRGANHPVKNLLTGKSEITSQSHDFVIEKKPFEQNKYVELTHINLNDDSVEGFRIKDSKAFAIQFLPRFSHTQSVSIHVFNEFVKLMK